MLGDRVNIRMKCKRDVNSLILYRNMFHMYFYSTQNLTIRASLTSDYLVKEVTLCMKMIDVLVYGNIEKQRRRLRKM